MHPFRIFLFLLTIVMLVFLFQHKESIFNRNEEIVAELVIQPVVEVNDSVVEVSDSLLTIDTVSVENATTAILEIENQHYLNTFFKSLSTTSDTLVRILYFGDSQIEGDRITFNLRQKFQHQFGGSGIGYLPAQTYFNSTEGIVTVTNDFVKHRITNADNVRNEAIGVYGSVCSAEKKEAKIRIKKREPRELGIYSTIKLMYSGKATINYDDKLAGNGEVLLSGNQPVDLATMSFDIMPKHLSTVFTDMENFRIYALLLDNQNGIAVDNIPSRGALNLMLNKHDSTLFIKSAQLIHAKLVVLHFGVNLVVDIRSNYKDYQTALERDIRLLKKWMPGVSVLVIGASDMARKVDGNLETYPNIEEIIRVQRLAAQNQCAAFWDMQQAMGGSGSIIQWVEQGLARPDYAHLTVNGSTKVGETLARDLMDAYTQFKNRVKK